MKLEVQPGVSFDDMLAVVKKWWDENAQGYNILRTKANIYFTLKSSDGSVCPANDGHFVIDKNSIMDEDAIRKQHIGEYMAKYTKTCLKKMYDDIHSVYSDIEHAEFWYRRAKERGTSTILKWRIKLKQLHEQELLVPEKMNFYEKIASLIDGNNVALCTHTVVSKPYDDNPHIYCRVVIDKDCTVLDKPLYLYSGGRFLWDDKEFSPHDWVRVLL